MISRQGLSMTRSSRSLAGNSLTVISARPPEIDCNHHEIGIFIICIVKIASLSDPHKLKRGNFLMKIRDYRDIQATAPMPGVSKRVPIGPEEGAPNFIMRVFEISPRSYKPGPRPRLGTRDLRPRRTGIRAGQGRKGDPDRRRHNRFHPRRGEPLPDQQRHG